VPVHALASQLAPHPRFGTALNASVVTLVRVVAIPTGRRMPIIAVGLATSRRTLARLLVCSLGMPLDARGRITAQKASTPTTALVCADKSANQVLTGIKRLLLMVASGIVVRLQSQQTQATLKLMLGRLTSAHGSLSAHTQARNGTQTRESANVATRTLTDQTGFRITAPAIGVALTQPRRGDPSTHQTQAMLTEDHKTISGSPTSADGNAKETAKQSIQSLEDGLGQRAGRRT